jgi:hypothetical protein
LDPKAPPKLAETQPERGPARQAAWACVLSNLVLPGVGTYVGHRRVAGILQLVISQTGFAMCLVWAILFARDWVQQGQMPEGITPSLALGLTGATLFMLAWIWSLISSVEILVSSRKSGL